MKTRIAARNQGASVPQGMFRFGCASDGVVKLGDACDPNIRRRMTGVAPFVLAVGMAFALTLFTGCQNNEIHQGELFPAYAHRAGLEMVALTNRLDPSLLVTPTNSFTLGPGDRIEIESLDDPASKVTEVVGPDGKIYFNLLPGVDVWGLTLPQTKARLEHELSRYVRGQPLVDITLRDVQSRRIWLLGRVQAPGVYMMPGPMTLLEAISMAGGSLSFVGVQQVNGSAVGEDLADLKHSFLIRRGRLVPVDFYRLLKNGDLSQNVYLEPDDFIFFAPAYAKEVYVLGAVTQPKAVPYTDGLTLAGAIAGAFGTVKDAYVSHVTVVRGSLTQPEAAAVNYKAIVTGKAADVPLEPHDIIYVPYAPYQYLKKYADIAIQTFVSSAAINAGSHIFAQPNAVGAGVFIPVGSGIQITPPPVPPIH